MQTHQLIRGRIVHVTPDRLLVARGARLLQSRDGGNHWEHFATLTTNPMTRMAMSSTPVARLLRLGIHHVANSGTQTIAIANKHSYRLNSSHLQPLQSVHGSRPMALCEAAGDFYYGEYRSNPKRTPIHLWRWQPSMETWSKAWTFTNVRHIHGVFHDPYTDAFWITTGDSDNEAAIWRSDDNFATLEKIAGGSQQYRAVQLLFSQDYLYFGSDAPDEQNHIYRMNRLTGHTEPLAEVGGSVFYGCKVGDRLFFSTAVEPSQVNNSRCAELWGSEDGANWHKIAAFRKDRWPMKYFQYGQILFPGGPGDDRYLYFSPFATHNHGITFKIRFTP